MASSIESNSESQKSISIRRFLIGNPLKNWHRSVSTSKKDLSKRLSMTSEMNINNTSSDMTQSCSQIPHAVSMPALTCNNCLQQRHESDKLRLENNNLRRDLKNLKHALENSQKSEKALRDRLASEAQKQIKLSEKFEDVSLGNNRPTALIHQYGALYSQTRLDALDSLDSLPQLAELENLKNKLLFSVIVLSFRQCQQKGSQLRDRVMSTLGIRKDRSQSPSTEAQSASKAVETCVSTYLRQSVEWYDLKPLTQEIQTSIYSTLYDYPCLKQCNRLKIYIEECVKIAWKLSVQNPPCHLEFDCRKLSETRHVRFHSSNGDSDQIRSYIWPALLDAKNGMCLYKGVVLT